MKYFINYHTYEPLTITSRRSYKFWFILLVFILVIVLFVGSLFVIYYKSVYNDYRVYNDNGISLAANEEFSKKICETVDAKKLVCYYNTPSSANSSLIPSYLEPDLCTHINIAFANIRNKTIQTDDKLLDTIRNVLKLKERNAKLKVLLSIGGAGAGEGFTDMIVDHASRKTFIKSVKLLLHSTKLDGIDLDWEFPAVNVESSLAGRQRQHFSQLLREIRMEYIREKQSYLLTVAVAAPKPIVDAAYDVGEMNKYVDFVNVMTYDFHYYTSYTPVTGLNSPLYPRTGEYFYMSSLNINSTVHMYLEKGMDRNKIIIGIPTFGHTFTLMNPQNTAVGSPASGYGKLGFFGFVDYPIICDFIRNNSKYMILNFDMEAMVPYVSFNGEWVSFDNKKSCIEKANFINEHHFGGAMIYSLNSDDYLGRCSSNFSNNNKFPLTHRISKTVLQCN